MLDLQAMRQAHRACCDLLERVTIWRLNAAAALRRQPVCDNGILYRLDGPDRFRIVVVGLSEVMCALNAVRGRVRPLYASFAPALHHVVSDGQRSATSYHELCVESIGHYLNHAYLDGLEEQLTQEECRDLFKAVYSTDAWPNTLVDGLSRAITEDAEAWGARVSGCAVPWAELECGLQKEMAILDPQFTLTSPDEDESGLAALIPPYKDADDWVTSTRAATLEGLRTRTLSNYRQKRCPQRPPRYVADDLSCGIDGDGRMWRRVGTKRSHPKYYVPSLLRARGGTKP